jgi:hypothetical protein
MSHVSGIADPSGVDDLHDAPVDPAVIVRVGDEIRSHGQPPQMTDEEHAQRIADIRLDQFIAEQERIERQAELEAAQAEAEAEAQERIEAARQERIERERLQREYVERSRQRVRDREAAELRSRVATAEVWGNNFEIGVRPSTS